MSDNLTPEAVAKMMGRLSDSLEIEAADMLEALAAKLAEVTAERDEATNQLDSARHSIDVLEAKIAKTEICPSCREPLALPSGDGCASMTKHAALQPKETPHE